MTNDVLALLRQRLASFNADRIDIEDESQLHAGHAGAREGGHYRLTIVSAAFAGKGSAERHRLVYAAVGDLMQKGIHALAIRALTPDEV